MSELAKIVGKDELMPLSTDEVIAILEKLVGTMKQAPLEYEHLFPRPGIYERVMRTPANCVIIGLRHRTASFTKIVKGKICVWDEYNGPQTLDAPAEFISPAGVRRVGVTVTPIEWHDFFETEETDVAALEKALVLPEQDVLSV